MTPKCPKCSNRMTGPTWDKQRDVLVYHCTCGYKKYELCHDSRKITENQLMGLQKRGA